MNIQGHSGIEWTKTVLPDGSVRYGFTWNPVAGCKHQCRWRMPDGTIARCYAEAVAEGVAMSAYPQGFEHHYWNPHRLNEPLKVKEPSKIFIDSMSDLMGTWVPEDQINSVLSVCRRADWHIFQLLTKNAPRLLKFEWPRNVWVGVSSAPDFMLGQELSQQQKERYMHKALTVLQNLRTSPHQPSLVTWMSFEPLSWDMAPIVAQYPGILRWAVIGAASNGPKKYQPNPKHVERLLDVLDDQGVPIFFKGNLEWQPWREEFPESIPVAPEPELVQACLF